ncbi:serine hydrolase domain-containing protein [Streptomyces abyssomicinicus]|uniref:serine hydrolase domain-containing protein n=1 Tax=Streptomyces abyssomicinicus TaxID=574929 RepID=UPI00124FC7C2|nr:serine hydrolase domain-containing protein [Streptomyces abyssomicinicus]
MAGLNGYVDERFAAVREAAEANLAVGAETGLSVYLDIDGERVIDLWGGHADAARTRPWERDTVVNVWSTTKTVASLAALMLVDRGELDVDAPVAKYWPEFATDGKEGVLVRHVLSHTSGVSGWAAPFDVADLFDWERSTAHLAAQAPWWTPGEGSGYHLLNFGHLVGEVVRRVSGKPLKRFVDEEISGPLGADFRIGAREADWGRCAEIVPPPPMQIDPGAVDPRSVLAKTLMGAPLRAEIANTPQWRLADIGGANGHGNAASIARILSVVSRGGEVDGVRLLSPETIELIFREQAHGVDQVLAIPLRWGIGYALPEPAGVPFIPEGRICFWGGWGGSQIVMDLERRMTFCYVMNEMKAGLVGSETGAQYLNAVYAAV